MTWYIVYDSHSELPTFASWRNKFNVLSDEETSKRNVFHVLQPLYASRIKPKLNRSRDEAQSNLSWVNQNGQHKTFIRNGYIHGRSAGNPIVQGTGTSERKNQHNKAQHPTMTWRERRGHNHCSRQLEHFQSDQTKMGCETTDDDVNQCSLEIFKHSLSQLSKRDRLRLLVLYIRLIVVPHVLLWTNLEY